MNRLDNTIALISGAASGIGAQTSRLLVEAGAEVVLTDINEAAGAALARDIVDQGERACF